jgi:hypothetical protein
MFLINCTSTSQSSQTRCLVFESITIARVIAEKVRGQGFDVEILDESGEVIIQDPPDPYRRFLGAHI